MMRFLSLALALLFAIPAAAQTSPEAFLTGNWLEISDDPKDACGSPVASGEQIAFEFTRSGGRLMQYEPADLFTSIGGLKLEEKDGVIAVSAVPRDGERRLLTRIRRIGADNFEFVDASGKARSRWRRCPAVPDPIGVDVSLPNLLALTPAHTGGQGYAEILPGETAAGLCAGKSSVDRFAPRGWLQFELLAPGHSILITNYIEELLFFVRVTAIHQPAPDTLRLTIDSFGKGLNEINIRIAPDHIEIPELHAQFARCKDATGMGRM